MKNYWRVRKNKNETEKRKEKKKIERAAKVLEMVENWIPSDLTDHPDFPEYLDGYTHEIYAVKIENYWLNRRRKQLKRKLPDLESVNSKLRLIAMHTWKDFQFIHFDSHRHPESNHVYCQKKQV